MAMAPGPVAIILKTWDGRRVSLDLRDLSLLVMLSHLIFSWLTRRSIFVEHHERHKLAMAPATFARGQAGVRVKG
jgi:hypothetical protein